MRVRFGDCLFDSETRRVVVLGQEVHLQPLAFQLLQFLIESRPRVVSKQEIHEKLWAGTFVSDGTLTSLVAEVRNAIGDEVRQPRFLRTVHRVGYAFSGEVAEVSDRLSATSTAASSCWLIRGRRRYALAAGESVVGRDPGAPVSLEDPSVSRRHAVLHVSKERVLVEDLKSKNGTYLGNERVHAPTPLADGDRVRFGNVELTFRQFVMPDSTRTAAGRADPDDTPSS
jgi:DNA-binding winged helix-turn-helix (wHTH) protein